MHNNQHHGLESTVGIIHMSIDVAEDITIRANQKHTVVIDEARRV